MRDEDRRSTTLTAAVQAYRASAAASTIHRWIPDAALRRLGRSVLTAAAKQVRPGPGAGTPHGRPACRWCLANAMAKVNREPRPVPTRMAELLLGEPCPNCMQAIRASAQIQMATRLLRQRRDGQAVVAAAVRRHRAEAGVRTAADALAAAGCPDGRACDRAYVLKGEDGEPQAALGLGHRSGSDRTPDNGRYYLGDLSDDVAYYKWLQDRPGRRSQ